MELTDVYESLTGPLSIGTLLHAYRTTHGMTLSQMERKLGLAKGNLARIESGKKEISLKEAVKFATKLKDDQEFYVEVWLRSVVRSNGLDPDLFIKSLE